MCVSPKTVKVNGKFVSVPCGHCYQCIRKRKFDWEIRIRSEMSVSTCSFFSLISYNPENLPEPMVSDKAALQALIRRLRRFLEYTYGKDVKLKYFIVSEYGEMRNRLHYHAAFFIRGIEFDRYQWKVLLEREWGKGFCSAYLLDGTWIHYAVKYMQKKYNMMLASRLGFDAYDKFHPGDWIPPDMPDKYPKYYIKGKGYPLPRSWYVKKYKNYSFVNAVKCADALNASLAKRQTDYDMEYLKQCTFLSQNPDCAESEKVYYNARKGLDVSQDFD